MGRREGGCGWAETPGKRRVEVLGKGCLSGQKWGTSAKAKKHGKISPTSKQKYYHLVKGRTVISEKNCLVSRKCVWEVAAGADQVVHFCLWNGWSDEAAVVAIVGRPSSRPQKESQPLLKTLPERSVCQGKNGNAAPFRDEWMLQSSIYLTTSTNFHLTSSAMSQRNKILGRNSRTIHMLTSFCKMVNILTSTSGVS